MTGCDPAVGVEERNVVAHEIEMTVPLGLKFLKKVWQLDLRGQVLVDSSFTVSLWKVGQRIWERIRK